MDPNYFTRRRRKARSRIARIAIALRARPMTIYELMELEGTDCRKTVFLCLTYLRGEMAGRRSVRVASWEDSKGPPIARYGRGAGPDAPKPPPLDAKEVQRRKNKAARSKAAGAQVQLVPVRTAPKPLRRPIKGTFRRTTRVDDDDLEAVMDAEAARRARNIQPRRDSMISALFGPA